MRRVFVLLSSVVISSSVSVSAQIPLPAPEHALVIGVRSVRQPTSQGPFEFTLASGTRITVPPKDVHEPATLLVRAEVSKQASQPIDPALVFVLQIQSLAPVSDSHVAVTLLSGSTVRVAVGDVRDYRLTFLRTALAEAVTREKAARTEHLRTLQAEYTRTIAARIGENWQRNQGVAGTVKVKFVVQRDGRVTNIEVEQSGGEVLDLATMRALMLTRQVPPLPPELPENTLTVQLVFEYLR